MPAKIIRRKAWTAHHLTKEHIRTAVHSTEMRKSKGGVKYMRISSKALDALYETRDCLKLGAQQALLTRVLQIKAADITSQTIQLRHVKAAMQMQVVC